MDRLGNVFDCNPQVKLIKEKEYPLIDIDSITIGKKYPTPKEAVKYIGQSASKFCSGDTIMARITPCLENGKIAMVKTDSEACIGSTELFVFRGKNGKSINEYVYYFMKQDWIRDYAANSMTGASGRQRADLDFIKKIQFEFPDCEVQKRIVDYLINYDELIENNNERISLLEQIAEEIYKEWFVRFRFPGYEKIKLENGIPNTWQIKCLGDFGVIETGKTPSTENKENYGDYIMFVKTPDMHNNMFVTNSEENLSEIGNKSQIKKKLPANSIMVSCIGTGGVVAINAKEAHTNQQINSIVLYNDYELEWLYFTCKSLKSTIEMFGATGATMTNLSKGKFERLKVIKPDTQIVKDFNKIVNPIFEQIKKLIYQNENLIKQRDLLLPRLMTGKLEVK